VRVEECSSGRSTARKKHQEAKGRSWELSGNREK
jgi:hypothetical protein